MPERVFAGRLANLQEISSFVTQAAKAAGLDESAVYAVQLAVDEAATNVIEHSYGGEGIGDIKITCQNLTNGFKVILVDHGKPFNPEKVKTPNLNQPLEEVQLRGLGMFFMRQVMDEVKFEFSPKHGNKVTMIKRMKAC
jgi:serine/threonine-protein kinase RsbW